MPAMNDTPKNRFFLLTFSREKSSVTVLKRKKGMITVARISTSICSTSCSLRKLYGCSRTLVVKEKRSMVTSTTDSDVRLKRMCSRFIVPPDRLAIHIALYLTFVLYWPPFTKRLPVHY